MNFKKYMLIMYMALTGAHIGAMQQEYIYEQISWDSRDQDVITALRSDGANVTVGRDANGNYWGNIVEGSLAETEGGLIPRSPAWIGLNAAAAEELYNQLSQELNLRPTSMEVDQ